MSLKVFIIAGPLMSLKEAHDWYEISPEDRTHSLNFFALSEKENTALTVDSILAVFRGSHVSEKSQNIRIVGRRFSQLI